MSLEGHVLDVRKRVLRFVSEAPPLGGNVLVIRAARDMMNHAARLIRSLEAEGPWLFSAAPCDEPGANAAPAEAFFASWAASLRAELGRALTNIHELELGRRSGSFKSRVFGALGSTAVPAVNELEPAPTRFVGWFEEVAMSLAPVRAALVLIAFVDDDLESETVAALAEFARGLQSPRVRLILVDARSTRALWGDLALNPRVHVRSLLPSEGDPRRHLGAFLSTRGARVLVARCGLRGLEATARELGLELVALELPYEGAAVTEPRLEERIALPREPADRDRLELYANRLERIVLRLTSFVRHADRPLLVTIDLSPIVQGDHAARWVESLARCMFDPRVKLIVIEGAAPTLSTELRVSERAVQRAVREIRFSLSARNVALGAKARLREAGVPARERFAWLLTLAGFHSGKRQFDSALRHAAEATVLAAQTNEPAHPPMAALSAGYIHYQRGAFEDARDVLTRAIAELPSESASTPFLAALLNLLASSELRLHAYADAAALFDAAAAVEWERGNFVVSLHIALWRGESFRRMGKPDEARAIWMQVLEDARNLEPHLADARAVCESEALERLARLDDETGQRARASALHDEALAVCPGCHVAHEP